MKEITKKVLKFNELVNQCLSHHLLDMKLSESETIDVLARCISILQSSLQSEGEIR